DPVGRRKNFTDCDKVKALLSKMGVPYTNSKLPAGSGVEIKVGSGTIRGFDAKAIQTALTAASYPSVADPAQMNIAMIVLLLTALIALAGVGYAPQAAALVEMFPTRIRYTA